MNKRLLLAALLISLLPACLRKKHNHALADEEVITSSHEQPKKALFVEDVEEYELSQESDPFASIDQSSASMPYTEVSMDTQTKADFRTVYFDFDRYEIRPDQRATLELNLARIKKVTSQGNRVMIEGHACNSAGSTQYNLMLSEKRAKVVADYLIKHGVDASMIDTVGRGDTMCIVKGGSAEQQAPNRRVEFYVLN